MQELHRRAGQGLLLAGSAVIAVLLARAAAAPASGDPAPAARSDPPRLVCLLYHRFVSEETYATLRGRERIYSISQRRFEQQMRRLRELGFHAVTLDDAVAFAQGQRRLPQPAVLIAIDDGCRSALTRAGPILKRYGLRATLFVTADAGAWVFDGDDPQRARLADDELAGLDRSVFDLGAHGLSHRPLTQLSDARLAEELAACRRMLERVGGRPVRVLAAPGNWYDDRVKRFAAAAGYDAMFVSDRGPIRPGADVFALRRNNVAGHWNKEKFERILSAALP